MNEKALAQERPAPSPVGGRGWAPLAVAAVVAVCIMALGWRDQGVSALLILAPAAIGALIVVRTGNRIGRLFELVTAVGLLEAGAQAYLFLSLGHDLPGVRTAALAMTIAPLPVVAAFAFILLWFPTGRTASRRWHAVSWILVGSSATLVAGIAMQTTALGANNRPGLTSPLGVAALHGLSRGLILAGGWALFLGALASVAAPFARIRGAGPEERLQLRWLATAGGLAVACFAISGVAQLGLPAWIGDIGWFGFIVSLVVGVPGAVAVAILRYRLYDLDLVVRRTVVVGLAAAFIGLVYAIVVGLGSRLFDSSAASFVAAVVLAVGFQPARDRARNVADRIVFGKRATPYEVLADFSGRVGGAYTTDDVLERMAQVLAEGTGAVAATVWTLSGSELLPAATWPAGAEAPADPPTDAVEVRHRGEHLGALSVLMPPSEPMNPATAKLVADLAAQAGPVLRNVGLVDELRASRQRIVAAQDEERRKLERDIHDGAQQQLVALAVKLRLLEQIVPRDPAKAASMASQLQTEATEALETLRDLAHGIYPPLLADRGLATALEAQARKSVVPTAVAADRVGRYGPEVEAAVYFSVMEALQNVGKYAAASSVTVHLEQTNGVLRFDVADDGRGFDAATTARGSGLQGMNDRLAAVGGKVSVSSAVGAGTHVTGSVPVGGTLS